MTTMEVKKDGLRQTQDGIWKLTLTVHPNDMSVDLMTAPMGTIYQIAMVEVEPGTNAPIMGREPARKNLTTRAVMMCKDAEFQEFCDDVYKFGRREVDAEAAIYQICNIMSRSQLTIEEDAANRFLALCGEFDSWRLQRRYENNLSR